MNFIEAFSRTVRCYSGKTAVITDEGWSETYGELDRRTTRLANALEERVGGARIATLSCNGVLPLEAMLASHKRGVANVQLPFRESQGGIVSMLEPTGASALLFDDSNVEKALGVLDRTDFDAAIHRGDAEVDHEAVESYEAIVENASSEALEPDPAFEHGVFYTSGTTSTPKAVLHDQESMWLGSTQVVMEMGIDESDVALVTSPWYHMVTCDAWMLPHIQAGATMVIQTHFDPDDALELIETHDATGLLAVPTQLRSFVEAQRANEYAVETLSYIRTGGSIVTESLVDDVSTHLTPNVYNTYGLTEGGPNLAYAPPSLQTDHPGTIGNESFMWELRVVEPAETAASLDPDATVGRGGTGEVLARGKGATDGYLGRPEATEQLFVGDWLRTGDIAEVDSDGNLHIVGRADNMIVSGGENIYPEEVEEILEGYDAIEEAVVIGAPDDHWGERVACVACVGAETAVSEDDLDEFCRDHDRLANFKRPREYVLTSERLPRTDTGTIERETVSREFFEIE
ncbi:class I adenylate-forming enzyme family protein [Halostagnicola kamekurae]|uniref:Acyl-CoA synthetase (AMP-forming)/AMP-acid ligase II n=1 Tax=Halostagnicola kamekurae TaxID=619731 RepID=A0A1I6TJT1_9EURY|nr:class I adenylate-forming enzyme family protein [Halostagnicola kamekurae]SFS89416.1 Acyl-CoA synthetase (AMP-forming)/AMP-acid ligase II [Halostagnicola kamekurae]